MNSSSNSYSASSEVAVVRKRRGRLERIWLALKKAPLSAWFGLIVVTAYCVVALFAPWIAPYGEAEIFPAPFGPWDETHRFGTDQIGRDIFTRLIYGWWLLSIAVG